MPSLLASLEVPKNWFENHTAFGRWINTFKHRSLSFVDILDYNFFLFEDFKVVSSFIQTTPGKMSDPISVTYPILVKIFYCNLSFITVDGFPTLTCFVKGQEIVISKTLINDLVKFSFDMEDSTLNFVALQNAKYMFVLASHSDFSPTKQLTHNGLNLCGKLLHTVLVKTVLFRNSSCELVIDAHLILMWKVASVKTVDYASLIISTMHFCSSPLGNSALPYANFLTLVFDHFNLLSDLKEVDYSGPQSLSSNVLPSLGIFKVNGKYEL